MPKTAPLVLPAATRSALKQIGKSLARARLARRDTREVAAERLGVHPQTIGRMERGDDRVAVGTVFAMMTIYGRTNALQALAQDDDVTVALSQQLLRKRGFSS